MRAGDLVRVIDAPGFEDFDAVVSVTAPPDWPVDVMVVGFEWEGARNYVVVPSRCVHPRDESGAGE